MAKAKSASDSLSLTFVIKSIAAQGGGAERVLSELASNMASRELKVSIVTFDPEGTESFYHLDDRITVIRIGPAKTSSNKLLEHARLILAIRRTLLEIKPSKVISFMISSYIHTGIAALGLNCNIIASEHTVYEHYTHRPIQRLALNLVPVFCTAWVTVSEHARNTFPARLRKFMGVIPNPTPAKKNTKALTSAPPGKANVLLTVGRLDEAKNHSLLLNAFHKVHEKLPNWQLKIAGDGPLRETLERQANSLGLEAKIKFLGFVKEIDHEYRQAQAFAMPSRYESFGLATAEALAHGLPVIGIAECEGTNRLVVDNRNGLLVDGRESATQKFAEKLFLLLSDDELRQRLASSHKTETKETFNIHDVTDKWISLINDL